MFLPCGLGAPTSPFQCPTSASPRFGAFASEKLKLDMPSRIMPTPAPTFGRRNASPDRSGPAWRSGARDGAAERFEATLSPIEFPADEAPRVVPNSVGAGVLTGAVIGVLHMAMHLGDPVDRLHVGPLTLDLGTSTLPLLLTGTLWAGGRAGFSAAFIVHGILRRVGRIAFSDYAILGGAVGLVVSTVLQALGQNSFQQGWLVDAILGAFAGALYRLFAGAAPT